MTLKIGSHVSMSAPHYLVGALKETLSYGANSFMIYSGAPQNTKRISTSKFKIDEAYQLMKEVGFDPNNIILHAPYIINLGNTQKPSVYELAVDFLVQEIQRAQEMKVKIIVLHPGSHVSQGTEVGIASIVKGLNEVFEKIDPKDCVIALETMAGKGSECGRTFEELKQIYEGVEKKESLGFCLDTCHIHDAGYDLEHFDEVLEEFDRILGLENLKVLHVNDSKNPRGAQKDRHENIGFGEIGFESLLHVFYHPKLEHVCKILETPYVEGKAPYKYEIEMIRQKTWNPSLKEEIAG